MLETAEQIVQTDISWRGLSYLKGAARNGRTVHPVACDAGNLPFLNGSFDGIICSEVLEHIEDDRRALWEIARATKPGGELVLTCPIHQKLFDFDDKFVGHYRRYEIAELLAELSRQGFGEFQIRALLGSLEKGLMLFATKIFSVFKRKGDARSLGKTGLFLARLFFPFYLLANYLLAGLVFLEARSLAVERAATICIRCRKSN